MNLKPVRDLVGKPFPYGTWRNLIFHAHDNGFAAVVVRVGRRVYIDVDRLEAYLETKRGGRP